MHDSNDEFRQRFALRYGSEQYAGVAGIYYDMIKLLLRPGMDTKDLLASMKNVKAYPGVMGSYDFREVDGDSFYSFDWVVKKIVSANEFRSVGRGNLENK